MTLLLTYLFVALFVSFLCSVLEAVLLSSTPSYIETLSKNGDSKTAKKLKDLKSNIDKPISCMHWWALLFRWCFCHRILSKMFFIIS